LGAVIVVLRAARSKVPMVPAASGAGADAGAGAFDLAESLGTPIALRASFMTAMRRHRELSPRAADRFRATWVLAMGEAGSVVSSMVASLPIVRLGAPVGEHTSPCVWHFFDHGVVLDVDGALVLDPATGRGADHAWGTLISQLQKYRPE